MMECVCVQLFITWCMYLLLFKGVDTSYCVSETGSDVVQVCTSGTASGSFVHVDTRNVPNIAATCTCELDTGAGGIEYIDYNVNEGTVKCGLYFEFPNLRYSCQSITHQPQTTYTGFTYVQENNDVPACLSIKSKNTTTTVTCLEIGATGSSTTPASNQTVTVTISSPMTASSTTDSTTSSSITTGTPSINNDKDTPGKTTLGQTAIIGIAVGGGSIVLLVILVTIFCVRRRNSKSKEPTVIVENDMYTSAGGSNTVTDARHMETVSYINTHINTTFDDTDIVEADKDKPHDEHLDTGYDPILQLSSDMESSIYIPKQNVDDVSSLYAVVRKPKPKSNPEPNSKGQTDEVDDNGIRIQTSV